MRVVGILTVGVVAFVAGFFLNGRIQAADDILARIGKEVITRFDFETRVKSLPSTVQAGLEDLQKRKELLNQMVKTRVLVLEGLNRGLAEDPEVKANMIMARDDLILQKYAVTYLSGQIGEVSNEEVEKAYNTDPEMKEREYFKVSQIVVEKEEEAKEILERLKKGEPFKKMAFERSIDSGSKGKGGELDWFEKGKKEKEMESVVEKLEKGMISGVVKGKGGYYIFKLDEKRISPKAPLSKVRTDIIKKLMQEKLDKIAEKEVEKLKKDIPVEVFPDNLLK